MNKSALWSVMDPDQNPLQSLPKPIKFQLMVTLAMMWSAIFCTSAGILVWLPGYIFAHIALILIGLFGTNRVFALADSRLRLQNSVIAADRNPDRA